MQNLEKEIAVATLLANCEWSKKYQTLEIEHLQSYAEVCLKSKQSLIYK